MSGHIIGAGDPDHVLAEHPSVGAADEDASGVREASVCEPNWGRGCVAYAEPRGVSGRSAVYFHDGLISEAEL
jgi:hypothetical protein